MENEQVERVVALLRETLADRLMAVYLYGSAVSGGLRPASDLDLFVVASSRTTPAQRKGLVSGLRPLSARDTRPAPWRPIELTIVARPDIVPWRYPPRLDFQSGEWLRASFDRVAARPWRTPNPDLAIVIAQVRTSGAALMGPPPTDVLPVVPRSDLVRAMRDEVASLVADIDTDTANVLLTLARIWHTLATGRFATKDAAADWALRRLSGTHRLPLEHARAVYLGQAPGSWEEQEAWAGELAASRSTARVLVGRIAATALPK